MCLFIKQNKLKAEKDIICYKVINDNFTSYYRHFPYELNKLYHTNLGSPTESITCDIFVHLQKVMVINEGFHSFINMPDKIQFENCYFPMFKLLVIKCIIPKGSEYYIGKDTYGQMTNNCYCSDSIILTKIIN